MRLSAIFLTLPGPDSILSFIERLMDNPVMGQIDALPGTVTVIFPFRAFLIA
jgi:hypothetical protein